MEWRRWQSMWRRYWNKTIQNSTESFRNSNATLEYNISESLPDADTEEGNLAKALSLDHQRLLVFLLVHDCCVRIWMKRCHLRCEAALIYPTLNCLTSRFFATGHYWKNGVGAVRYAVQRNKNTVCVYGMSLGFTQYLYLTACPLSPFWFFWVGWQCRYAEGWRWFSMNLWNNDGICLCG